MPMRSTFRAKYGILAVMRGIAQYAEKPKDPPHHTILTGMRRIVPAILLCSLLFMACHRSNAGRDPLTSSAWVDDAAIQRGYIRAGDVAQFGCPPGWMAIDETAAALRGKQVSTTYVGTDPRSQEAAMTCVAQKEFALPAKSTSPPPEKPAGRRPLTPVWISAENDGITIGFARELPPSAPIYIGQDTPCGPRVIGVELGDLLKWLADPSWGATRHFLGMVSGGCPEQPQR
jgi:hypothetical protein